MTFFGDAVAFLTPVRPVQDFALIPLTRVQQVHQDGAHLRHRHLWLFFPPIAVAAAPKTRGPTSTAPYDGASLSSHASRIRPDRILLCPPENSAPPTNARHALAPAFPTGSRPAHSNGGT